MTTCPNKHRVYRNEDGCFPDTCASCERLAALATFVAGYLHGRSSLGNHDPAGREAEAAFNKWWDERNARLSAQ